MIAPICDLCGRELDEPGGLLFGPPNRHHHVRKRHLCVNCYGVIVKIIGEVRKKTT